MNIYKVLPELKKQRQMQIWQKALRAQWSAEDLNWSRPQAIRKASLKDHLSRILTPVLMGEQAALYSVSGLIPVLGHRAEVESQFYLTTWAVDEARHTELFARYYERIDREPMSIRSFPSGYLFQSRIVSNEPAEWLAGVLVSEVLALRFMQEFKRIDIDPVLGEICDGILQDESRHLGFNHIYLEDRFGKLFREKPAEGQALATHLRARIQHVLEGAEPVLKEMDTELAGIGIDREALFQTASEESLRRLNKSIAAGQRIADGTGQAARLDQAAEVGNQPS